MLSHNTQITKISLALLLAVLVLIIPLSNVVAANPIGTGQPNQSCEVAGATPGNAVSAPGSAFNPDGVSGMVYAGEQSQNSKNPFSVSQYDVACFQVSQH